MRTALFCTLALSGCCALPPTTVTTAAAPTAIGPYSQARVSNGFVFAAGQIAIDPATQQMIDGDIKEQTRRVLLNLKAVLEAAGTGMDRVVKTTVYLTDLAEFPAMNEVYAEFFPSSPPARATVQVAALPKKARVEIDAVAAR